MQGKNKEDSGREETRGDERVTAWLMTAERWGGGRGHANQSQTRRDPYGEERHSVTSLGPHAKTQGRGLQSSGGNLM